MREDSKLVCLTFIPLVSTKTHGLSIELRNMRNLKIIDVLIVMPLNILPFIVFRIQTQLPMFLLLSRDNRLDVDKGTEEPSLNRREKVKKILLSYLLLSSAKLAMLIFRQIMQRLIR